MLRRLVQKEVDRDEELQLVETTRDESIVRQGDLRIEADTKEPANLAAIDAAKHLVNIDAGLRNLLRLDAPNRGDVLAMLCVTDVAHARKLVTLLAVFTSALTITLTGDRCVAAAFAADASRGQHNVDRAQHVLYAVAVVLDAARVQQK